MEFDFIFLKPQSLHLRLQSANQYFPKHNGVDDEEWLMTSLLFTLSNGIFSIPSPSTWVLNCPENFQSFLAISRADLTREGLYNELGNLEEYKNIDTVQRSHSLGLELRNPDQEHSAGGTRERRHQAGHRPLKRCKKYSMQCVTHNGNISCISFSNETI